LSFTIEKHFCGDTLIDVAVFSEVKKCNEDASGFINEDIVEKTCCKDKIDVVKGQDEVIIKTSKDLELYHQLFIAALAYSYKNLFEGLPQLVIPHKDYSPPTLIIDRQVVDQVFLI
jgi:hypothetical protein